jgi:hypothetical protein
MAKNIKNTKEVVGFFIKILNWVSDSLEDGAIGFRDILSLAPCLTSVRDAIDDIGEVPSELSDLSEAEKIEIVSFVREELDLTNDTHEGLAEYTVQLVFEIIRFYAWIKNKK